MCGSSQHHRWGWVEKYRILRPQERKACLCAYPPHHAQSTTMYASSKWFVCFTGDFCSSLLHTEAEAEAGRGILRFQVHVAVQLAPH